MKQQIADILTETLPQNSFVCHWEFVMTKVVINIWEGVWHYGASPFHSAIMQDWCLTPTCDVAITHKDFWPRLVRYLYLMDHFNITQMHSLWTLIAPYLQAKKNTNQAQVVTNHLGLQLQMFYPDLPLVIYQVEHSKQ